MSEEAGGGGGGDERRRRRRRRGGGGGGEATQASSAPAGTPTGEPRPPRPPRERPPRERPQTQTQPQPPQQPRPPREGRPPQREGRPPQREGPPRAAQHKEPRPPRQHGDRSPRPPGDRPPREERAPRPRDERPAPPPRAPRAELRLPRALESLGPADVTIPAAPPPPPSAPPPPAERWGDDSDAPTPDIRLRPDAPLEAADPDGEQVFLEEDADDQAVAGTLVNIAGVKLQPAGKIHDVDAGDASYARGDLVIIETDRGPQLATVAIPTTRELTREPLRRIVRRADARDVAAAGRFVDKARDALRIAKERVRARRMAIKMFKVDVQAGGNKAVVYFSSEDRIDFRDLVRDLTHDLKLRVEMRQTGVRDEAKLVGGIGSCGRELCCTTFLPHFEPVSIKMAKDQGLVLNPTKVSGQCGRLKCCLVYEQATYQEMRKGLPKLGKRVTTPAGEGRVAEVDVLRRRVRVAYAPGEFQTFEADQVASLAATASTSVGASTSMASRSLPQVAPAESPAAEPEASPNPTTPPTPTDD